MNRGNMRDLARKRLGETTAVFWLDDELNDWINYAGHDVVDKTRCIQDVGLFTTTVDADEYTLTSYFSDLIGVTEVYFRQAGDNWSKLDFKTRKEMDLMNEGWMDFDSSTPQDYIFEFERGKLLTLSPAPDTANSGSDYCKVYYEKDFTNLTNDDGVPAGIDQLLQLSMVDFVVAYGYESRGYITKAREAWGKYSSRISTYLVIRDKADENDSDIVMKGYRNIR